MHDLTDSDLLRDYAERNSDEAFAVLVGRYMNLVYSAALRKTGTTDGAEEIVQAVFIIFAKKAHRLHHRTVLSGWLYQTTRFAAASYLRTETRRVQREHEAYMQSVSNETKPEVWAQIAPMLEDAMGRLSEKERTAVMLRFFEGKSFSETAVAINASENAAKKRIGHALEKLRKFFAQRGVVSTTALITAAIAAHSVQAAPVALTKAVTAVGLARGAAANTSTATLIEGALKIMAWKNAKTGIIAGIGALLVAGTIMIPIGKMAAQNLDESWRTRNLLPPEVDELPPQVKILPSKYPEPLFYMQSGSGFEKCVGAGVSVGDVASRAYRMPSGRVRFLGNPPKGRYDFIATLPDGAREALQQELKDKLGFVGRRETKDTDVLLLTIKRPDAPGLRPPIPGKPDDYMHRGHFQCFDQPIYTDRPPFQGLARFLEIYFGKPVVDQTGLTRNFSIDLKWDEKGASDPNHQALKQALLDQLGLALLPDRKPAETLIVERVR